MSIVTAFKFPFFPEKVVSNVTNYGGLRIQAVFFHCPSHSVDVDGGLDMFVTEDHEKMPRSTKFLSVKIEAIAIML